MAVIMEHEDKIRVEEAAKILSEMMKIEDVQVLPPADGFRAKEKDRYRKIIYIKGTNVNGLIACREKAQQVMREDTFFDKINVQFDINPMNLY